MTGNNRNFATVAVRQSLSSCCNLAYRPNCSLRQIHMARSSDKFDSRGALIVLEGLDRCGKTSQCGRLHSYLEELGHAVELWRFPDRNTGVGQMISSYLANKSNLDDRAIHLLFSANRWEKRSTFTCLCICWSLSISCYIVPASIYIGDTSFGNLFWPENEDYTFMYIEDVKHNNLVSGKTSKYWVSIEKLNLSLIIFFVECIGTCYKLDS